MRPIYSGVTGRGVVGWGRVPPSQRLLTGKFLLTYREKRDKEKRENGAEKKENLKREGGKLKMKGGKVTTKWGEDLFFFFLRTTEICFGSTKMGIFYWKKAFHAGEKMRKNDFAPSEKFSSNTPAYLAHQKNLDVLSYLWVPTTLSMNSQVPLSVLPQNPIDWSTLKVSGWYFNPRDPLEYSSSTVTPLFQR